VFLQQLATRDCSFSSPTVKTVIWLWRGRCHLLLPELPVAQEVLNRHIIGQTITTDESIPPGAAIVIRDLTGVGFDPTLAAATLHNVARRGNFLVFRLAAGRETKGQI
jgi:hypothetical protein